MRCSGLCAAVIGLGLFAPALACQPHDAKAPVVAGPTPDADDDATPSDRDSPAVADAKDPMMLVTNPGEGDITIHGAQIVDASGAGGTMDLIPDRHTCEGVDLDKLTIPGDGHLRLPAPHRPYPRRQCQLGAVLPAGRYIVRLDSGYGQDYYAAAEVELPLEKDIELRFEDHSEQPWHCDDERARRAAVLGLGSATELEWLPSDFFEGCDPKDARCGTTAVPPQLPPQACTITLHEGWLRVDRPAGDDAPRWFTANVDREVAYASMPRATLTGASRIDVDGKTVRLVGRPTRHRHVHGGDAARIGFVTIGVDNPLGRALRYRVTRIEALAAHQCEFPTRVRAQPKLRTAAPKELPPGSSELSIHFAPQSAYQAHCDRFATRVTLSVEGQKVAVTTEHQVTRFEPLRK